MADPIVLVTGANGFYGTQITKQLLEDGCYRVRATVRSLKDQAKVETVKNLCPEKNNKLELAECDLEDETSWLPVVRGCTYVIHTAGWLPLNQVYLADKEKTQLMTQLNVQGTEHVMKACTESKTVKRLIVTSSAAAIAFPNTEDRVLNEESWTEVDDPRTQSYFYTKTLAEKTAWEYYKNQTDGHKFEMVILCPSYTTGPSLKKNGSHLTAFLAQILLQKAMEYIPNICWPLVDIRDVAKAHVAVMTSQEAEGKRFLLDNGYRWFKDLALLVQREFEPQGYDVPTEDAPEDYKHPLIEDLKAHIGRKLDFDSSRMKKILNFKFTSIEESFIDMCYDMIEKGLIKKTDKYHGAQKQD